MCAKARALDEFDTVKCGADIAKALIGRRSSNERVVVIEARHKSLALRDLGGWEVSDRLFLSSWSVCGTEFEMLINSKTHTIRDAIAFPSHSTKTPEFMGECLVNGRKLPDAMVAVLDNSSGYNPRASSEALQKATVAWRIDEVAERFVVQPVAGLRCPLGGVITLDGGP